MSKAKTKGFTIIELLVVIAIIGLLSSVVLVSMRGSTGKAKIAKGLEFSQTMLNVIGVDAVGIWSFDEGSGDYAYDKSGYGNHGTRVGKPDWVTGEENTPHWYVNEGEGRWALDFNGTSDYINCGNSTSLKPTTNSLTIESWVYWNGGGDSLQNIVTKLSYPTHGYRLHYYSNGSIRFAVCNGSTNPASHTSTNILFPERWNHIVGTYDGTDIIIYLNGKEVKRNPMTGSLANSGSNFYIGGLGAGEFVKGKIDEVRIYASALSSAEIQQHYAESLPRHQLVIND